MSDICTQDNCRLEKFKNSNKCVLHCKKNEYYIDYRSSLLLEFYKKLKEYILYEIFVYPNLNNHEFTEAEIDEFLTNNHKLKNYNEYSQKIFDYLKTKTIVLTGICFPERDSRDYLIIKKF